MNEGSPAGGRGRSGRDIHATQFYNVELDNATPMHVYGSVQDSGSHRVALSLSQGRDKLKPLDWEGIPGGEGSNQAIDPTNPNIVYDHQYYGQFMRLDFGAAPAAGARGPGGGGGEGRETR